MRISDWSSDVCSSDLKIRVAAEARDSRDFLIIARTDARTAHGLDEALRRAEAFVKAGADILFVESPESVEEMERIGRTFDLPLLVNVEPTSGEWGKGGAVRVSLGGGSILKKKNK